MQDWGILNCCSQAGWSYSPSACVSFSQCHQRAKKRADADLGKQRDSGAWRWPWANRKPWQRISIPLVAYPVKWNCCTLVIWSKRPIQDCLSWPLSERTILSLTCTRWPDPAAALYILRKHILDFKSTSIEFGKGILYSLLSVWAGQHRVQRVSENTGLPGWAV